MLGRFHKQPIVILFYFIFSTFIIIIIILILVSENIPWLKKLKELNPRGYGHKLISLWARVTYHRFYMYSC